MVFESIIADYAVKYSERFIKNINKEQLKVGIFKGEIRLNNIELSEEGLDSYNLPFVVKGGYLGSLSIDIPWIGLPSKPITVNIDRVFLLLGIQSDMKKFSIRARHTVDRALKLHARDVKKANSSKKDEGPQKAPSKPFKPGYFQSIVMNLQVKVTNIHVRFEDDFSNCWHPWAAGFTLESLSLSTKHVPKSSAEGAERFVTKSIEIAAISVYWDPDTRSSPWNIDTVADMMVTWMPRKARLVPHTYLLRPVSIYGEIALRRTSHHTPCVDVQMNVENIADVRLEKKQFDDLMALMNYLSVYGKFLSAIYYRPSVSALQDPRGWWFYAGRCVLDSIITSKREFAWKNLYRSAIRRRTYTRAYYSKLLGRDTDNVLMKMEEGMAASDIVRYRTQVEDLLRKAGNAVSSTAEGQVFIIGRVRPIQDWDKFELELFDVKPDSRLPLLTSVAKEQMARHKSNMINPKTNALTVRIDLNAREARAVLTDSRVVDLLTAVVQNVKVSLQNRVQSLRADVLIGNMDVKLADAEATSQLLCKQFNPMAPYDVSVPFLRLSLEWVKTKAVYKIKGLDLPKDHHNLPNEWAVLIALAPMDVLVYEPHLLDLSTLFKMGWRRIERKKLFQGTPAELEPIRKQDHTIKLILSGVRMKHIREKALGGLLFQPEGHVIMPGLEISYTNRDFASVFGFLRQSIFAPATLMMDNRSENGYDDRQARPPSRSDYAPSEISPDDDVLYMGSNNQYARQGGAGGLTAQQVDFLQHELEKEQLARKRDSVEAAMRIEMLTTALSEMGKEIADLTPPGFADFDPTQELRLARSRLKQSWAETYTNIRLFSRRRYIVLEEKRIAIYKSNRDYEEDRTPVETYPYSRIQYLELGGSDGEQTDISIKYMPSGLRELKVLFFKFETVEEAVDWIRALSAKKAATASISTPTPSRPASVRSEAIGPGPGPRRSTIMPPTPKSTLISPQQQQRNYVSGPIPSLSAASRPSTSRPANVPINVRPPTPPSAYISRPSSASNLAAQQRPGGSNAGSRRPSFGGARPVATDFLFDVDDRRHSLDQPFRNYQSP